MLRQPEIHCPACGYKPRIEDRWTCVAECGTVWHTFWTGGVCPGCTRPWKTTQCPTCEKVSPHRAWYHLPGDPPASRTEPAESGVTR
ncbi:MAG: hypothetical protein JNL30_04715 [Rubrivivax sp.]|nr:hypothetical protein [Rubrivivax sp.]